MHRFHDSEDAIGREMYADAYSWLVTNDTGWPYSFCNVCKILGLSNEAVLNEILAESESSWRSHARRISGGLARSVKTFLSALFTGRGAV